MTMTLTDAQKTAITSQLNDAQTAYHNLITGQNVAQVRDQNGETITYSVTKIPELAAYIAGLQAMLGQQTSRYRRPLRVFMGR